LIGHACPADPVSATMELPAFLPAKPPHSVLLILHRGTVRACGRKHARVLFLSVSALRVRPALPSPIRGHERP